MGVKRPKHAAFGRLTPGWWGGGKFVFTSQFFIFFISIHDFLHKHGTNSHPSIPNILILISKIPFSKISNVS